MARNLRDFQFNLFGIDHTITHSNANDYVALQYFIIYSNLTRGYKTKVITLPPTRNAITSNEKKYCVDINTYSIDTCSSGLHFFICFG